MVRRAATYGADLTRALAQRPARAALVAATRLTVKILDTDPLSRRLLSHPAELDAVARRVGAEELRRIEPHLQRPLIDFVIRAQAAGEVVDATPTAVIGALRTVGLLVMHRDRFGAQYSEVLDLTIESLATGLCTPHGAGPTTGQATERGVE